MGSRLCMGKLYGTVPEQGPSLLAATAVGVVFAFLDEEITGRLAAKAWPHWYIQFARTHKHLGLELSSIVALTLPVAVLAAGSGVLLGSLARKSSIALPCFSVLVWQLYNVGVDIYSAPAICPFTMRSLWDPFIIFPTSSIVAIALPACALMLAFRLTRGIAHRSPDRRSPRSIGDEFSGSAEENKSQILPPLPLFKMGPLAAPPRAAVFTGAGLW